MTYAGELATYLACHAPALAGGAGLLVAAARRWRDRRATGALLAVAGAAIVASVAPHTPVPDPSAPGFAAGPPLVQFAVRAWEAEPVLFRLGLFPPEAPDWCRWLLFAVAAACGSLAALPGRPHGDDPAGPAGG